MSCGELFFKRKIVDTNIKKSLIEEKNTFLKELFKLMFINYHYLLIVSLTEKDVKSIIDKFYIRHRNT